VLLEEVSEEGPEDDIVVSWAPHGVIYCYGLSCSVHEVLWDQCTALEALIIVKANIEDENDA
jgi:hypothetical protein